MADTVARLNERFGAGDDRPLEPDIVVQLQSIMNMHALPVQELFYKWEAYCIKMDLPLDQAALTMERLRAFKQNLQDALERRNQEQQSMPQVSSHAKKIKTERMAATPRRNAAKGGDVYGLLDGIVAAPSTPGSAGKINANGGLRTGSTGKRFGAGTTPNAKTPSKLEDQLNALSGGALAPASPFADRPNAGEVVEVLNQHLPAATPPMVPYAASRIKLTAASDQKKLVYKPLAMKLSEASEILDDRIDEFTTLVMDHHKIDYEAFGSAASQSTSEIVAVGRIASDAAEGKLNAASVVLETSRRMGGGLRVPLDLSRFQSGTGGFQFFPGQIVALRGTNSSGSAFSVSQILEIPLLPNAASTHATLAAHRDRMRGGDSADDDIMDVDGSDGVKKGPAPLNILFASGPYTADDNLDFEPLHTLVSKASDTSVDSVVLAGPFLDADHPLIATGDFDLPDDAVVDPDTATLTTLFRYLIAPALQRLAAANPSVTILLVPSVRDVIDKHVSWPQDAFPRRELGLPKAARIVGNPITLSMNEMVLGVSSQDVLYELRHEEVTGGRLTDANAMSRACRYLLEQRHYFPLFPPVDRRKLLKTGVDEGRGIATGPMLDTSYLKLGEMVNVRPDVLITPSTLPPFAKVVESVLVINPGYLSRRRGAGTYARMTLYAAEDKSEQAGGEAAMVGHKIFERARVEITKI